MNQSGEQLTELATRIGVALRASRTARGMSLSELSKACGLSRTILSRIESGAGNPSIETLWRLSHALNVPLGTLIAEDQAPRVRLIRPRAGEPLQADSGMRMWPVHAEGRKHRSEMYELELPKGTTQRTDAHLPGTEELLVCVRGHARIGPVHEELELRSGEAVWFAADREHRYLGLADTRLLGWMLYRVGSGD